MDAKSREKEKTNWQPKSSGSAHTCEPPAGAE